MPQPDQRLHAQALMYWLIAHEAQIGYNAFRPMKTLGRTEQQLAELFANGGMIYPDCSEAVTLICKYAGFADPTGNDYDGYGNSQTMFNNLGHYLNPARAGLGAIVVFGVGGTEHAAMVMDDIGTGDPWLFSHGSASGPKKVRYSVESSYHSPPATFLNVGWL